MRPAYHRPPSLPAHIPFDGGVWESRTVRKSSIQAAILFTLLAFGTLYLFTDNVIYLYLAGVGVGLFVLGALAWTALMCVILCREDEETGDEETGEGGSGKRGIRGKEDAAKKQVMAMEMKVEALQETASVERSGAEKGVGKGD
ncbi:hypothetical protein DE146DRAFT_281139 [Phaeosphaeria sp. MPI-PUGE-AT-0046c]|nr:hypothetical protein DE146DRAFT_281139 [Phaeosphaeria sp. MPI-PUGE-AT-0046c]